MPGGVGGTFALLHSFVALCIKSVSKLLYHQAVPHSFSKLPGCHPTIPILELVLAFLHSARLCAPLSFVLQVSAASSIPQPSNLQTLHPSIVLLSPGGQPAL